MTKIEQIEHFQTRVHRFSLLMPIGDSHHHHSLYIMYASRFKSPKNPLITCLRRVQRGAVHDNRRFVWKFFPTSPMQKKLQSESGPQIHTSAPKDLHSGRDDFPSTPSPRIRDFRKETGDPAPALANTHAYHVHTFATHAPKTLPPTPTHPPTIHPLTHPAPHTEERRPLWCKILQPPPPAPPIPSVLHCGSAGAVPTRLSAQVNLDKSWINQGAAGRPTRCPPLTCFYSRILVSPAVAHSQSGLGKRSMMGNVASSVSWYQETWVLTPLRSLSTGSTGGTWRPEVCRCWFSVA